MHYPQKYLFAASAALALVAGSVAVASADTGSFALTTPILNIQPQPDVSLVQPSYLSSNVPVSPILNSAGPEVSLANLSPSWPGVFDTSPCSVLASWDPWAVERKEDPSMHLAAWSDVFDVARLGVFEIPLRSDPAERTNILLSAQAVDGITLQPGEVFSFNDVVGERSAYRGYQDGWMFDNGHLVRGTGGGICLVATGLYNAALHAGLGLIERHPHSGVVHYADPGCDAAVAYGSEDMKFENTTSGPLLIRTICEDDRVLVAFFGTPPPPGFQVVVKPTDYTVLASQEIQVPDPLVPTGTTIVDQQPRPGYKVTVERIILQNGRVVQSEVVASDMHSAVNKIVRVPMPETPAEDGVDKLIDTTLGPEG